MMGGLPLIEQRDEALGEGEEYDLFSEPELEPEGCVACGAEHQYPLCRGCAEERWDFVAETLSHQVDAYVEFWEEVAA